MFTMEERKKILRDTYDKKRSRISCNFFDSMTDRELRELVIYATRSIMCLTRMDEIVTIKRNDLLRLGFGQVLNNQTHFNFTNTYDLIKLAYPMIKPWMVATHPTNIWDDPENIMELIDYQFGSTEFTWRDIGQFVHSRYLKKNFESIYQLKNKWLKWKEQKAKREAAERDALTIYQKVRDGNLPKFPNCFWSNMSADTAKSILRFCIENLMYLRTDSEIYHQFKLKDLSKYKLGVFVGSSTLKTYFPEVDPGNTFSVLNFAYPGRFNPNYLRNTSKTVWSKEKILQEVYNERSINPKYSIYKILYSTGLLNIALSRFETIENFEKEYANFIETSEREYENFVHRR